MHFRQGQRLGGAWGGESVTSVSVCCLGPDRAARRCLRTVARHSTPVPLRRLREHLLRAQPSLPSSDATTRRPAASGESASYAANSTKLECPAAARYAHASTASSSGALSRLLGAHDCSWRAKKKENSTPRPGAPGRRTIAGRPPLARQTPARAAACLAAARQAAAPAASGQCLLAFAAPTNVFGP